MTSFLENHDRSMMCGELRESHIDDEVTLFGWVDGTRDLGGMVFVDLRDRTGIVQVRFDPDCDPYERADNLGNEWCVALSGTVESRGDNVNDEIPTGRVEVAADDLHAFSESETTPFPIRREVNANEMLRLEYRYLDLRRQHLKRAIQMRSSILHEVRTHLHDESFQEVETPYLTRSTPEGARDYLVPSRVNPGKFYALPQSPQLFKQILMVSGFDRYFQIVRCFRDEDLRADRQPEFTQIDMEMSFVTPEDVIDVCEGMISDIFESCLDHDVNAPFRRMSYDEALATYGLDDPDLRFGLPIVDVSDEVADCEFRVFSGTVADGGVVRGIRIPDGVDTFSRSDIEELEDLVGVYGAKGLAWAKVNEDGWSGPIARFFDDDEESDIGAAMEAEAGDLVVFVADEPSVVCPALGHLREHLGEELDLIDEDAFEFCWITEFPMVEWNDEEDRWDSMHHPFTAPRPEDVELMEDNPEEARAQAYDLVLNGHEVAGGSIRIHDRDLQHTVFDMLNISPEEAEEKFGFLLEAFKYGPPPHGGIAFGVDRLIMLMVGMERIRDVIAFPKTQRARDRMSRAPSSIDDEQLAELHLETTGLDQDDEDDG